MLLSLPPAKNVSIECTSWKNKILVTNKYWRPKTQESILAKKSSLSRSDAKPVPIATHFGYFLMNFPSKLLKAMADLYDREKTKSFPRKHSQLYSSLVDLLSWYWSQFQQVQRHIQAGCNFPKDWFQFSKTHKQKKFFFLD